MPKLMPRAPGISDHTICTASGIAFDLANPTPDMVEPHDILYALASIPRFAGHVPFFRHYPVGLHCIYMTRLYAEFCRETQGGASEVPPETMRQFQHVFLHDAAEAYCLDVPSPLKRLMPDYPHIEARIQHAIYERLGLELPDKTTMDLIKHLDYQMLIWERRDLFAPLAPDWWPEQEPDPCYAPFMFKMHGTASADDVHRMLLKIWMALELPELEG